MVVALRVAAALEPIVIRSAVRHTRPHWASFVDKFEVAHTQRLAVSVITVLAAGRWRRWHVRLNEHLSACARRAGGDRCPVVHPIAELKRRLTVVRHRPGESWVLVPSTPRRARGIAPEAVGRESKERHGQVGDVEERLAHVAAPAHASTHHEAVGAHAAFP